MKILLLFILVLVPEVFLAESHVYNPRPNDLQMEGKIYCISEVFNILVNYFPQYKDFW